MAKLSFIHAGGGLVPADPNTKEYIEKLKHGEILSGEFKKTRNGKFHRKYFALLWVGFEIWQPDYDESDPAFRWGLPEKNFDKYRNDVQVLAGFGEPIFNLDGTFRMKSKSISFANMDDEEFSRLYSAVLDVVLRFAPATYTQQDVEEYTERVLSFV